MQEGRRPVVLVTGSGRSIGRAVSELMHSKGYSVAVADYDAQEAEGVAAQLSPDGSTARAYRLDVRSTESIAAVFEAVEAELGTPMALVNNAGVYPNHAALDISEAIWDQVLDTNLKGSFFCAQALARGLVRMQLSGAIVNIASTAAFSARPGAAPYGASKAGLVMLTKSLAQEFGPLGIRVNAVAPGLIEVREGMVSQAYRDQFLTLVPNGRIGAPRDISNVVAFLLTKDADYVNGECIVVDGGFLAGRSLQRSDA